MGTSTIASRHNHIHISTVEHLQAYRRMNYNGETMIVQDANTVTCDTSEKLFLSAYILNRNNSYH